jgi:hypothetical protein
MVSDEESEPYEAKVSKLLIELVRTDSIETSERDGIEDSIET